MSVTTAKKVMLASFTASFLEKERLEAERWRLKRALDDTEKELEGATKRNAASYHLLKEECGMSIDSIHRLQDELRTKLPV